VRRRERREGEGWDVERTRERPEARDELAAEHGELRELRSRELFVRRQLRRERIHVHAVPEEHVMQVRPGREAAATDVADDLPLQDLGADADAARDPLQM